MNMQERIAQYISVINDVYQHQGHELFIDQGRICSDGWWGAYEESYDEYDLYDSADTLPIPQTEAEYEEVCKEILRRVFEYPIAFEKEQMCQYEAENYGVEFAKQLKSEWQCFSEAPLSRLRIVTQIGKKTDNDGKADYSVNGDFVGGDSVFIFGLREEFNEYNKMAVRHEVIHWMLDKCGYNSEDDGCFFWFFASLYSAHPYKPMDETNKKIYDIMMEVYQKTPTELQQTLCDVRQKGDGEKC